MFLAPSECIELMVTVLSTKWVYWTDGYWLQPPIERLTGSLGSVSLAQKASSQLYRRNVPLCMSTQCPGMSLHMMSFTMPPPHISTASDKHWGKKAWVRG